MGKCKICGEEVILPFQCSFCGGYFCIEHRLPENHMCLKVPPRTPLGPWKAKKLPRVEYTKKFPKSTIQACAKCGSTSIAILAFDQKVESLQCKTCGFSWRETREKKGQQQVKRDEPDFIKEDSLKTPRFHFQIPTRKVFCATIMMLVALAYVPALEWALAQNIGEGIVSYLPWAFVLAMCHELLHAAAWWYYGYSAIPIPILIPPILGITIGQKPRSKWHNLVISLAPILLTITSLLVYHTTANERYLGFGMINLFGMGYDIVSVFIR